MRCAAVADFSAGRTCWWDCVSIGAFRPAVRLPVVARFEELPLLLLLQRRKAECRSSTLSCSCGEGRCAMTGTESACAPFFRPVMLRRSRIGACVAAGTEGFDATTADRAGEAGSERTAVSDLATDPQLSVATGATVLSVPIPEAVLESVDTRVAVRVEVDGGVGAEEEEEEEVTGTQVAGRCAAGGAVEPLATGRAAALCSSTGVWTVPREVVSVDWRTGEE
jgi:hypothetical protein